MAEICLKGKVALVSGGTKGLGAAIVEELLTLGATVYATYLNDHQAAKEFQEEQGSPCQLRVISCDVRASESYTPLLNVIESETGRLDILVNNAGINMREFMEQTTEDSWDAVLGTNLRAPFFFTKNFWALLRRSAPARVINISSAAGQYYGPKTVHYAVSKTGLNGLTKVLARYGAAHSVYVNAIAPGLILTEQTRDEFESGAADEIINATTLLKRPGEIADVKSALRFLVDPQQNYLTGQVLNLSGGAVLNG